VSFDLLDVGPAKLYPLLFGDTVQLMNDLDGQFPIGRISDVFLLDDSIDDDSALLGSLAVQGDTHGKDLFYSLFADPFSEVDQVTWIAGIGGLVLLHAAEVLVVGISLPLQHQTLVTEVLDLFEQKQAHHQANRFGGPPFVTVVDFEGLMKIFPVDRLGQGHQQIVGIEHISQERKEKIRLMAFHRIRQQFSYLFRPEIGLNLLVSRGFRLAGGSGGLGGAFFFERLPQGRFEI